MIKKTLIFIILIFFIGCSSLIGKNKITQGIESYNTGGPSEKSILDLGQGLGYYQNSPLGIQTFRTQHAQLVIFKENILAKTNYTYKDLENLRLYLLSSNFANNLASKVPELKIDTKSLPYDRELITKIFEDIILKEKTNLLSRTNKISKINYYKKILNVIKSPEILNKIKFLEQEVTINLYIRSSSGGIFSYRNYRNYFTFKNYISDATDKRINSSLGNYVFLRGYVSGTLPNVKNSYFIDIHINSFEIKRISSKKEKSSNDENKIILIEKKSLSLEGNYNLYSSKNGKNIFYKPFSYDRNYEIKTSFNNNFIDYRDEEKTIDDILTNIFNDIIYSLNFSNYSF
ncbi:MAG: hypothetical protein ACRC6K_05715 [Fusobacteriaceae bacterium]